MDIFVKKEDWLPEKSLGWLDLLRVGSLPRSKPWAWDWDVRVHWYCGLLPLWWQGWVYKADTSMVLTHYHFMSEVRKRSHLLWELVINWHISISGGGEGFVMSVQ